MVIKNTIRYLFIVFCFLFLSCTFKKEMKAPVSLIPQDTMLLLITDLTLTEAALNTPIINDTVRKMNVLANYKISPLRFDSSFTYYTENPKKLKAIYIKVLENLNKK